MTSTRTMGPQTLCIYWNVMSVSFQSSNYTIIPHYHFMVLEQVFAVWVDCLQSFYSLCVAQLHSSSYVMAAIEGTFAESVKLTRSGIITTVHESSEWRTYLRELVILAENDDGEVTEVHVADATNLARRKQRAFAVICLAVMIQLYPTSLGSKSQLSVGKYWKICTRATEPLGRSFSKTNWIVWGLMRWIGQWLSG